MLSVLLLLRSVNATSVSLPWNAPVQLIAALPSAPVVTDPRPGLTPLIVYRIVRPGSGLPSLLRAATLTVAIWPSARVGAARLSTSGVT